MKFTLFGIVVEAYKKNALTRDRVEQVAIMERAYSGSRTIARIKAVRKVNKKMSLKDAKEWVEQNFED